MEEMKYYKKLEALNLIDNFLFGSVMTYPGISEKFSRKLLQIILNRDCGNFTVVPYDPFGLGRASPHSGDSKVGHGGDNSTYETDGR